MLNIKNYDLYCTRTRAADHLPLICTCGFKCRDLKELVDHNFGRNHKPFRCAILGCGILLNDSDVFWHYEQCHGNLKYYCAQCGLGFEQHSLLEYHASDSLHVAYVCEYPDCGSEFARIHDLNRHQLTHKIRVPRHPCPHCRKLVDHSFAFSSRFPLVKAKWL